MIYRIIKKKNINYIETAIVAGQKRRVGFLFFFSCMNLTIFFFSYMKTSFLREPVKVLPREPRSNCTAQGYDLSCFSRFDVVPRREEETG